jgi:N-acetylmuramic acid 6-phosphate etherase
VVYVGAGTSGRLGVLDASECPPTFRTPPESVQAIIAGGEAAVFRSQEGAEDKAEDAAPPRSTRRRWTPTTLSSASPRAGRRRTSTARCDALASEAPKTVSSACVANVSERAGGRRRIRPLTGPEVVTGSTRLKAGTATKLVLNAVTTIAMVRLGKVYENLMVDLRCSNVKLWDRGNANRQHGDGRDPRRGDAYAQGSRRLV